MASDDAKFEQARREAPVIEAFARIVHGPSQQRALLSAPRLDRELRDYRDLIELWGEHDAEHGTPRETP